MYRWETAQAVTAQRVFGIIRTAGPDEAVAAAEAVLNAGLHAVEIALTTPRALTALAHLAETRPDALLGAGTVIDAAAARAAVASGADALKLFPASAVSPSWLRDVRAALPQAPVLPTGGVTIDNAPEWIAAGAVACGIGSALTSGGARSVGERVSTLLRGLADPH
jgi:2-dehydro-3-deoxyphosphogluconate aldolase/(4S)-4-hydroxy-2-oxoglutarate aldolase